MPVSPQGIALPKFSFALSDKDLVAYFFRTSTILRDFFDPALEQRSIRATVNGMSAKDRLRLQSRYRRDTGVDPQLLLAAAETPLLTTNIALSPSFCDALRSLCKDHDGLFERCTMWQYSLPKVPETTKWIAERWNTLSAAKDPLLQVLAFPDQKGTFAAFETFCSKKSAGFLIHDFPIVQLFCRFRRIRQVSVPWQDTHSRLTRPDPVHARHFRKAYALTKGNKPIERARLAMRMCRGSEAADQQMRKIGSLTSRGFHEGDVEFVSGLLAEAANRNCSVYEALLKSQKRKPLFQHEWRDGAIKLKARLDGALSSMAVPKRKMKTVK
jgi:hypothetical protein